MLDIGIPELLIVLVIVILIFGPGRIAKTMGELGKGIQSFRESFSSDDKTNSVSDTKYNSEVIRIQICLEALI